MGTIAATTEAALKELYGPYRVDLMGLASQVERALTTLEVLKQRHPDLYIPLPTDREIVADAVQDWLGHDFESIADAVRRHMTEMNDACGDF